MLSKDVKVTSKNGKYKNRTRISTLILRLRKATSTNKTSFISKNLELIVI